jgi:cystathionine beta-lyase
VTNSPESLGNFAGRSSSKFRRFPEDVLPMHVAEMDFEVASEIRDRLAQMVANSDLGYLGPLPELTEAFSGFAMRRWGWDTASATLKLATDVGVAAVELLRHLAKPGDRVLINTPVYSAFMKWLDEAKLIAHDAPLQLSGDRWQFDIDGIEQAFADGVKLYLLCSPQNPVGTVHTRQELSEVARLAKKYDATVIADEIHAPLSWAPFTPYLSLGEDARATGIIITSSSKAWNTAGLKAAFVMTQSDQMRQKLAGLPEAMNWRASLLGAFSMVTAFESGERWLDQTVETIQVRLGLLRSELAAKLPKAKMFAMESTYLAWIDLSAYGMENPQQQVLSDGKVALVAGEDHDPAGGYGQFVRFNFATSETRLKEAVSRMAKVLEA